MHLCNMCDKICLTLIFTFLMKLTTCEDQPSIVIIGAGPSGIAAATKLLKNNFTNIKILEAENRIGGRINSVKFGDAYVDLGAEWIQGEEGNVVYSLVKDLNLLKHTEFLFKPITSKGKDVDKKIFHDLERYLETMSEAGPEIQEKCGKENSFGKCYTSLFNSSVLSKYKNEDDVKVVLAGVNISRWHISSLDGAMDWDDVALTGSEYEDCKGDLYLNWDGRGSKTVLEVLMQEYPPGVPPLSIDDKIILNKEIVNISNWDYHENATVIQCNDGSTFTADHVIFTPSLGVLKANHETLFQPGLPSGKVDAIKNIGFGAIAKVIMHFPERWWDDDSTWIIFWLPEEMENLKIEFKDSITKSGKLWPTYIGSIAPAENNPKVLIAWYSAEIIPELEELSDDVVLEGHRYLVRRFFGNKYNVTDPDQILRTEWYTNRHFQGTYSYESTKGLASGGTQFQRTLAAPLLNKDNGKLSVQFAGEATDNKHFGTVHGAVETGFREADRIIDLYKK